MLSNIHYISSSIKISDVKKIKSVVVMVKRSLFSKHNYDVKLEEFINKQIQAEQQAAQDYLKMAVNFLQPSVSCFGAGGFFIKMHKEELKHSYDFINYQLLRGATPTICGLSPPNINTCLTLPEAFQLALSMEKEITEILEKGVSLAEELKDYQCADFLTSVFLKEQFQSIQEMARHVTNLNRISTNEHALFHYDLRLSKQYPFSNKIE